MPISKIAITIDKELVEEIDLLVKANVFPNRSRTIDEKLPLSLLKKLI